MNSDEVRVRAARFHFLRVPLTMEAAAFLYYEDDTVVRPCYTKAVVDVSQQTHPSPTPCSWRPGYATVVFASILTITRGLAGGRTYPPFNWPIVANSSQREYPVG
jgi:hypothetical protein